MTITNQQFTDWLGDDSAMRCLLIEAGVRSGGSEITRYMSDVGYTTSPTDTPANTEYEAIIAGGIRLTEQISLTGSASMTFGDFEFYNTSGERDSWLDDIWTNRTVKVYIGDVRWPRADFRLIFDGVAAGLASRARNRLNLKLRDKLQRLNTPISETKLGGTGDNKDRLLPVTLGEVHNVEPLLTNEATHEYQVHIGNTERIIEVRDDGVPVQFTATLGTGKFTLNQQPQGQITVSVQGDKTPAYTNTVAGLVQRLALYYGKSDRFTLADLDTTNINAYDAAHPQPVGVYIADRANVLETCQKIAASLGTQLVMSRQGLLRLIQLAFPPSGTPTVIDATNMYEQSLQVVDRPDVVAAVKLAYCQNYTVQAKLQSGLPDSHKDMFGQQWLTTTKSDATTAANYKLNSDPEQQETCLLVTADADAEATRRLNIQKVQRTVYQFEGFPELLMLELGSPVTLISDRYGLNPGKTGVVVNLQPDWLKSSITVQVMI